MSSTGQALSTQDLQDLDQIRQALPPNDPRVAKIHALVGANAQQPTQFEKERDPNNQPGFWKTAWSDVKNLVPSPEFSASDIPVFGSAIGAAKNIENAKQDYGKRKTEGRSPAYNALSTAVEGSGLIPGLNPRGMEESANAGDAAGVMGHTAVPAALAAAPLLAEGASAARKGIGESIHDPLTGRMTPVARGIARGGGAAAGGAIGAMLSPGAYDIGALPGMYAGREFGPSVMEKMFPGPAGRMEEAGRAAHMNRGYQSMAEEPRIAIPGTESEGRYATIEGNRLREMAPNDPAAIRQLNQRGVRIPMLTEGKPLIHTGEFGGIQVPENTISGRKIIIPPPQ